MIQEHQLLSLLHTEGHQHEDLPVLRDKVTSDVSGGTPAWNNGELVETASCASSSSTSTTTSCFGCHGGVSSRFAGPPPIPSRDWDQSVLWNRSTMGVCPRSYKIHTHRQSYNGEVVVETASFASSIFSSSSTTTS
ncbi:hypothetical protein RDI58_011867 [Solanum bulbocastanum]|uniref:Uncharacterized protein n=1 Tax=Solanum bulbocastanum TaxID=147425 RepID=A0AAN8TYW4_SOLBU